MPTRVAGLLLALVVSGIPALGCAANQDPRQAASPAAIAAQLVDLPARDFSAVDLEGRPVRLSSLKGKVVLLNFWGIWCAPCRIEVPELVQLHRRLRDRGGEIIGINFGDELEAVAAFTAKHQIRFPVVLDRGYTDLYEINAFPTNIILDRKGRVRYLLEGYSPEAVRRLEGIMEHLLRDPQEIR